MERSWLAYLFLSFAVGVACLGVTIGLAVRRQDPVSRVFLGFYAALSVMVTASLVLAFADAAPDVVPPSVFPVFRYLESIVGFYGLMLTLPLFVHRVFGVTNPRRERVLIAVVLATLGLQHVTEFVLGSTVWDERGDRLEDSVLLATGCYAFWIAFSRRGSTAAVRPLADRVLVLLLVSTPGSLYDLYFSEGWSLRFYPLWYCVTSVVVTWTLVQGRSASSGALPSAESAAGVPDGWGLSGRELEVADQVARGLSNKDIATALHISPNTVKTHLRTIFEKTGVRSRFELIAQMSVRSPSPPSAPEVSPGANHPEG